MEKKWGSTIAPIEIVRRVGTRILLFDVIKEITKFTYFQHHSKSPLRGFNHIDTAQVDVTLDLNKTMLNFMTHDTAKVYP